MPSPYSSVDDLLLGDMPLSPALSKQKFVDDAADEFDGAIGAVYQTPLPMASLARHVQLRVKMICNYLATGRLILAIDVGGEDTQLHAYGLSLLTEAKGAMQAIANGEYPLPGAVVIDQEKVTTSGPSVVNVDATSAVETFYGFVSQPRHATPVPVYGPLWSPGPGT